MQNKIKLYLSLFVLICGGWIFIPAGPGRGAEPTLKPIEPFGGLQWTDGLVQTTRKINQMAGLEKFYAEGLEDGNLRPRASLKGLVNGSAIINVLSRWMHAESFAEPGPVSYLDKNGVKHHLAQGMENGIAAEPILLKGSPFTLSANFLPSPGFAVTHPDEVYPATVKMRRLEVAGGFREVEASCAFVLTTVTLTSTTPLPADKIADLVTTVKDKYKDYGPKEGNGGLVVKDAFGGLLEVASVPTADGSGVLLQIKYSRAPGQWDQLYQAHLSGLEAKDGATKPDKSNDL